MSAQQTSIAIQDVGGDSDQVISDDHFGGIYIGYRRFERYETADAATGLSNVRWPGGAASEKVSWYGLEFDNLTDPNSNKPGLREMAGYAIANDVPLNVIIPTGEYKNDLARARVDFEDLLDRITSGSLGPMPDKLTFEIGNEYYAMSEFRNNPSKYGEVANAFAETMAEYMADNPGAFGDTQVKFTAQIGKSLSDNAEILSEISDLGMSAIDTLVFHRFAWGMDDADNIEDRVAEAMQEWVDAGLTPDYETYLSGWNVGSWTREEARDQFLKLMAEEFGEVISEHSIDLDARNHLNFESFWQSGDLTSASGQVVTTKWGVANRDYGLAQASAMVEILSTFVSQGVDSASLYGVDTPYAAHLSFGDDIFVGGAMMQMMSETLPGLTVMETGLENMRDNAINVHAFEGEGKMVLYVSVDELANGFDATVDLSALDVDIARIEARSLTSELDPNWMTKYDIVDRPDLDESEEGRLYETGIISDKSVTQEDGVLGFRFEESFEVVELVLTLSQQMDGTSGDDMLMGGQSDDVIEGLAGDDILDATQGGADILTGGAGEDVFVFGGDGEMDRITDFELGKDTIDLHGLTDGLGMVRVSLGEFDFVRMRRFEEDGEFEAGEIVFEQTGDDVTVRYVGDTSHLAQAKTVDIVVIEGVNLDDMSLQDFSF
jgi:hypothetical protein